MTRKIFEFQKFEQKIIFCLLYCFERHLESRLWFITDLLINYTDWNYNGKGDLVPIGM